jgi:K+-sensing histidine kinase KdpD
MPKPLSTIQRYGLAALSVSLALGGALLLERYRFRDVEVPLFLFAVAVSAWYSGTGGAVLALLLSCISFDYFFVEPVHTLYISRSDLPYFIVFASFASLVTWFSAVRRRVEGDLRQARDALEIEVAERTQQASLLNLTHDTIFVRDMSDVITYWNRELRSCTAGLRRKRSASRLTSFCGRSFRRRLRRFGRNCYGRDGGMANSKRPVPTEPS